MNTVKFSVGDRVEVKQQITPRRFTRQEGQIIALLPRFVTVATDNGYRITVSRHDLAAGNAEITLKEDGDMYPEGSGELGRAKKAISRSELIKMLAEGMTARAIAFCWTGLLRESGSASGWGLCCG